MSANRQFKSSVFIEMFSNNSSLLNLFNALTGSSLTDDSVIRIIKLDNILFSGRKNDIAFLIGDLIVIFIEHQSTINENMPIKLLVYLVRVYEELLKNHSIHAYKLIKIPRPEFIVLYNGTDRYEDEVILKLSDAFEDAPEELKSLDSYIELKVRVININEGRNKIIVERSEELRAYAWFVERVRMYDAKGMKLIEAVTRAVQDCIAEGYLPEFFRAHSTEVINMFTTEWKLEDALRVQREEGRQEEREIASVTIKKQEEELRKQEEELRKQEEELRKQEEKRALIAKRLHGAGMLAEQISLMMDLPREEVARMLGLQH